MNITDIIEMATSDYMLQDGDVKTRNEFTQELSKYFKDNGSKDFRVSGLKSFFESTFITFARVRLKKKKDETEEEFQKYSEDIKEKQQATINLIKNGDESTFELLRIEPNMSGFSKVVKKALKKSGLNVNSKDLTKLSQNSLSIIESDGFNRAITSSFFEKDFETQEAIVALNQCNEELIEIQNELLMKIIRLKGVTLSIDRKLISQEDVINHLRKDFKKTSYKGTFEDFLEKGKALYEAFVNASQSRGFASYFLSNKDIKSAQYVAHKELRDCGYFNTNALSKFNNEDVKFTVISNVGAKLKSYEEISKEYEKEKSSWDGVKIEISEDPKQESLLDFLEQLLESSHGNILKLKQASFKTLVKKYFRDIKGKDGVTVLQESMKDHFEALPVNYKFTFKDEYSYGYCAELMQFLYDHKSEMNKLENEKITKLVEENYHWRKEAINVKPFGKNSNIFFGKNYIKYALESNADKSFTITIDHPKDKSKSLRLRSTINKHLGDLELLHFDKNGIAILSYSPCSNDKYIATLKEPRIYFSLQRKRWEVVFPLGSIKPLLGHVCGRTPEEHALIKGVHDNVKYAKNVKLQGDSEVKIVSYDLGLRNPATYSIYKADIVSGEFKNEKYLTSGFLIEKESEAEGIEDINRLYYKMKDVKKLINNTSNVIRLLQEDPSVEPFLRGEVNENGNLIAISGTSDLGISTQKMIKSIHNFVNRSEYDSFDLMNNWLKEIKQVPILTKKSPEVKRYIKYLKDRDIEISAADLDKADLINLSIYSAKKKAEMFSFIKSEMSDCLQGFSTVRNENLRNIRSKETQKVTHRTYKKIELAKEVNSLKKCFSKMGSTNKDTSSAEGFDSKIWDYINGLRRNIHLYQSAAMVNFALDQKADAIVLEDLEASASKYRDKERNKTQSLWSIGSFKKWVEDKGEKHNLPIYYVNPFLTSKIDNETKELGCRINGEKLVVERNGKIKQIDADINASKNIGELFFKRMFCNMPCYYSDDMCYVFKSDLNSKGAKAEYKTLFGNAKCGSFSMNGRGMLSEATGIKNAEYNGKCKSIEVDGESYPVKKATVYHNGKTASVQKVRMENIRERFEAERELARGFEENVEEKEPAECI